MTFYVKIYWFIYCCLFIHSTNIRNYAQNLCQDLTKLSKMLSSAHRSLHPRMGRHTCKQRCYRYYIVEICTTYREFEHGELNSVWQKWKVVIGNSVMQKPRLEFCSFSLWFHQSSWILFPPHPLIELCLCFFAGHRFLFTILKSEKLSKPALFS